MSHYIGDCVVVYGPIGKRKDGEWSKRFVILAAFRDPKEASAYRASKKRNGVPVVILVRKEYR